VGKVGYFAPPVYKQFYLLAFYNQ